MALIFERTARNFANLGYYPTDSETLARILKAIKPAENTSGLIRILDPCCGEGKALKACHQLLADTVVESYGIELDLERAKLAKTQLTYCLQADYMDCSVTPKSMGLLFLNPPYGDSVSDNTSHLQVTGRKRLEKSFYQRSIHSLQPGGILVLIIPYNTLDQEFALWISKHCQEVKMFLAPEQKYHQLIIFGIRNVRNSTSVPLSWQSIKQGKLPPEIPEEWNLPFYIVPTAKDIIVRCTTSRIDADQLQEVIKRSPCLWDQFEARFTEHTLPVRRPLVDLSRWHLALALAAGQVRGLVTSDNGNRFLIKGDTYKTQVENVTFNESDDGTMQEVRTLQDRFVPVIKAIDVTDNSLTFGNIVTIS